MLGLKSLRRSRWALAMALIGAIIALIAAVS
jgi:hypothetical protein